jgi:hypothetical protein
VSKKSWLSAKLRQLLQSIRPTFLAVEARSNHDLFILNAAFELDPSATHILTNDHIVSNHRFLLDPLAKVLLLEIFFNI